MDGRVSVDGIGNNEWWINKHTCQNTFLYPCCAIFIGVKLCLSLFLIRTIDRERHTQSQLTNAFSYRFLYKSMHTFWFPLRHLEQKHTHLHIDFVNALFIYLFPLSCVGVTVIIIHSSTYNAKSKSMIFLFTAKNHMIQSHDKIYSHYFIVFGLDGKEIVSRSRWLPIIYAVPNVLACFVLRFQIRIIYNSIVSNR